MGSAKNKMVKIIKEQPADSSYDEILREPAFARMVERGLSDSDAGHFAVDQFLVVKLAMSTMYYLYILKCADDTLYIGITVDLPRRVEEHNGSELGAKYTRGRRPVELVFSKAFDDRSAASKQERLIKRLSKRQKLELIGLGD